MWSILLNNRRTELEIINQILTLSREGVRKTKVLYQVNLNHRQLNMYLTYLLEKNIIDEMEIISDSGKSFNVYKINEKGEKLLDYITKTLEFLK